MKKPLLFLLPLILFSCTTGKQLTETESLIRSNPDSARVVLENWDRSSLVFPRQKALHALLYSMALDKCYIDVADDSLTSVALNYFKNSRDKDHRMKAYYYDGLVQKNSGNIIGALMGMEKALHFAEAQEDWHYVGLIARNISNLHYHEADYQASETMMRKSYLAFSKAGEKLYSQHSLFGLARCCQSLRRFDESDRLHRLLLAQPDIPADLAASTFESLAALRIDREPSDPQGALDAINRYQQYGEPMTPIPAVTKARSLARLAQMDSSQYYLEVAHNQLTDPFDSAQYYYGYYEYYSMMNELGLADSYLRKCFAIEDSITTERLRRSVMHLQKEWYEQEATIQRNHAETRLIILILSVILFLFLGSLVLVYLQKKRRTLLLEIERFQSLEREMNRQLSSLSEHNLAQQAEIISMIVGRISVVTMLGRQYSALQDSPAEESGFDRFERQKQVIVRCKQEIEALRGDKTFLIGLEEAIDECYDHIITRLRKLFGSRMSEQDYQIIAMLVAGTPVKGISLVTGLEPGTISTRKTRYKERILKTGTPDAGFFIEKIYRKPITSPAF